MKVKGIQIQAKVLTEVFTNKQKNRWKQCRQLKDDGCSVIIKKKDKIRNETNK